MPTNQNVGPRLARFFKPVNIGDRRTVERIAGSAHADKPERDLFRFARSLRDGKRIAFAIDNGRWPRLGHHIWREGDSWREFDARDAYRSDEKRALGRAWLRLNGFSRF